MYKNNNEEYIEEFEEIEEEHDIFYFYRLLKDLSIVIGKKRTELFKNLIVSFRKNYPLSNFINNDEGPIFDFDDLLNRNLIQVVKNENNDYEINEDTIFHKVHCPICGSDLKEPMTIKNYYKESEENSTYFNQKVVYLKNQNLINKAPKQISFNYISCANCMKSIVANYNINGKPLLNSNLLNLYTKIAKYLGLELNSKLNKYVNARCIYPVDRLFFHFIDDPQKIFYFNLFTMCDYAAFKFKEYWNKIGKSAEEYDNDKMIVFTDLSDDMFNPSKFKDFRDFENWFLEEAKVDLTSEVFTRDQLKNFKFDILSKDLYGSNLEVQCEKSENCKNCNGRLLIPNIEVLFSLIPLRKSENFCVARNYKNKNKIIQPKQEKQEKNNYLEKEEISLEEIKVNDKILKEKKENKMGNDGEGILSPEEEVKLNSLEENQKKEDKIEEKDKETVAEKAEEIQIENTQEEDKETMEEVPMEENSEISDERSEAEDPGSIPQIQETENEGESEEVSESDSREDQNEDLGEMPINEDNETIISPLLEEKEEVEVKDEEKVEKFETENQIFEKAIENSEQSLLADMASMEDEEVKNENEKLIQEASNHNREKSLIDRLYDTIIEVNRPSQDDFIKTYDLYLQGLEDQEEKARLRSLPFHKKIAKGMELYIDYQIQDLYRDCDFVGKQVLNKYPGINHEDLQEYMFEKNMRSEIEDSRIKNDLQTRIQIEAEGFNYKDTLDTEDIINQSNSFLNKSKEKESREFKKNEDKCNVKTLFRTKDIKRNNPFVMQMALRDSYQRSPFRVVIDMVLKMDGYKAGSPTVTIDKNSLFTPVIDFADVGIRFVCIDTSDTKYWTFQENPVKMVNRVPFPNQEFAHNHSLNFLYSNECLTKPQQVAFSIFKLVNRKYFPPEKIVRLAGRGYPIAYTTEKQALLDFENDHSIFSGLGRAKQKSVTLIAFVDDENENKDYQNRKRLAERMSRNFRNDNHLDYVNTYKNLLDDYQMCYILSAHYVVSQESSVLDGIETIYYHYTITQYTENIYCIIEDGLQAVVAAIIREHVKEHPNTPYSITYEYDRTALVSPSVRKLLNNTQDIFNIDISSIGQSIADTNTTWVISESRFQKNTGGSVDDRARQDYRYFLADEITLRNFLAGKIRPDENLSNIEKILSSVGYFKYPEPKSQNFELTTFALDLLEHSSLFLYMFPIEIAKLSQDNGFDSYNQTYQEFLTAKFMIENNLNVPGSTQLFSLIERGAGLVNQLVNWWKTKDDIQVAN